MHAMRLPNPITVEARYAEIQVQYAKHSNIVPGCVLKRAGEPQYLLVLAVLGTQHGAYENGDRVFQVSCLLRYIDIAERRQRQGEMRIFIGDRLAHRWSLMC